MTLDASLPSPYTFTASAKNDSSQNSTQRHLLYSADNLVYAPHQLSIENRGPGKLLLDSIQVGGVPFGAEGSNVTNKTLDDSDPDITYNGTWTTNNSTDFWGGTSIYTGTPGDSFSFDFEASAVWIYGDQVNDHGFFDVYMDDKPLSEDTLSGRSGCGATTDFPSKTCEKLGGLHFFVGGIKEGTHNMRVVNRGSGEGASFFDLDRIVLSVPSKYPTKQLSTNHTCPFVDCTNNSTTPATQQEKDDPSSAVSSRRVPAIFRPIEQWAKTLATLAMVGPSWSDHALVRAEPVQKVMQDGEQQAFEAQHQQVGDQSPKAPEEERHTNNWAVLVCASRYWFNYRVSFLFNLVHLESQADTIADLSCDPTAHG